MQTWLEQGGASAIHVAQYVVRPLSRTTTTRMCTWQLCHATQAHSADIVFPEEKAATVVTIEPSNRLNPGL